MGMSGTSRQRLREYKKNYWWLRCKKNFQNLVFIKQSAFDIDISMHIRTITKNKKMEYIEFNMCFLICLPYLLVCLIIYIMAYASLYC